MGDNRKKMTYDDFCELAKSRGGEYIGGLDVDYRSKLSKWRCANGHEWDTAVGVIKSGSWCRKCSKAVQYDKYVELADSYGGKYLGSIFSQSRDMQPWKCSNEDHPVFMSCYERVKIRWCVECGNNARYSKEKMIELAKSNGGKYLGSDNPKSSSKELFECVDGHRFECLCSSIKHGISWCRVCASKEKMGEAKSRSLIEKSCGVKIQKDRPLWMRNPDTNRPLELDGLSESIGLAFEYQGVQHSTYVEFFHRTVDVFEKLRARDSLKDAICSSRGLILFKIDQVNNTKIDSIFSFKVREQAKECCLPYPLNPEFSEMLEEHGIDWDPVLYGKQNGFTP